jgi:hypothetical protein
MTSTDRRAAARRTAVTTATVSAASVIAAERRERRDRREQPRRRNELRSIAHVSQRIRSPHPRLDVNVSAVAGIRITAIFPCGCIASEPVGDGTATVNCAWCAVHAPPTFFTERRRR